MLISGEKPIFEFVIFTAGSFPRASIDVGQLCHSVSGLGPILLKVCVPIVHQPLVHRAQPELELRRVEKEDEELGVTEVAAQTD